MANIYKVGIENAIFFAPVGVHQEEHLVYNTIIANVYISLPISIQSMPVIDYSDIYNWIKPIIEKNINYLEQIIQLIVDKIASIYPEAKLHIQLKKKNPPIIGRVEYAVVEYFHQPEGI